MSPYPLALTVKYQDTTILSTLGQVQILQPLLEVLDAPKQKHKMRNIL